MKQTIKQKARKYLGSAIVGAGLALGLAGNGYASEPNLPSFARSVEQTFQREKQNLLEQITKKEEAKEQILEKFTEPLKKCNESLNEGIKDGIYTKQEQERTLTYFQELGFRPLSKQELTRDFYNYPSKERKIFDLLRKNLQGMNIGVPELQKYLKREGYSVKVQRVDSPGETILYCGLGLFGVIVGNICLSELGNRNNKNSEGGEE